MNRCTNSFLQGYAATYIRLSVLGVPHINNLVECTGVLPMQTKSYVAPDEEELEKWLKSDRAPMREEAVLLMNGDSLSETSKD